MKHPFTASLLVCQNSPRQGGDAQDLLSKFNQCQGSFSGHFYFYQSVVNTGFEEMGEEHLLERRQQQEHPNQSCDILWRAGAVVPE